MAKIPPTISFQQAATLVTGIATASSAFFDKFGVARPTKGAQAEEGKPAVLIWSGASSTGLFSLQLAHLLGYTVIATASPQHHDALRSLGATAVVDYRSPTVADDVIAAAQKAGKKIAFAVDPISLPSSAPVVLSVLAKAVSAGAAEGKIKLAHTLPWPTDAAPIPEGVDVELLNIAADDFFYRTTELAGWLFGEVLEGWLAEGKIVPIQAKVVEGGLGGLQEALEVVKGGGVRGGKVVIEL